MTSVRPGVTAGSAHEMPVSEYEEWAGANGLELILFDENYQWAAVESLRAGGAPVEIAAGVHA